MRWIGLIRNVMIGREGLDRATLLLLIEAAGGRNARSHLATGNLTFESRSANGLRRRLEDGIENVIGRREIVAIRPHDWLQDLVDSDPFAGYDSSAYEWGVAFLPRDAAPINPARVDPRGSHVVAVMERELLVARPVEGRAAHPNPILEAATGARATTRAWSTLERLARYRF